MSACIERHSSLTLYLGFKNYPSHGSLHGLEAAALPCDEPRCTLSILYGPSTQETKVVNETLTRIASKRNELYS